MCNATSETFFDDLADSYEALIDWPKRLAYEEPFFRDVFCRHEVNRVADVGCGTGHHAAMFHSWGLEVEGSDISPAMLARCRQLHGEDRRLRWIQRSFMEAPPRGKIFDAVVCLGNSLALAGGFPAAAKAIRGLVDTVHPGGVGVIQVLNLWSIVEGPTRWQKVRRLDADDREVVLLKGLHRIECRGFVDILTIELPESGIQWRAQTADFVGLTRRELESALQEAGADVLHVFGSYAGEPYQETQSGDLIVVWRRALDRC